MWSVDTVLWFCPFANRHNIYLSFTPSRSIDQFIMILITKPQPVSLCVFLCLGLSISYLCMFVFLIFLPICLSLSSLHLYDKNKIKKSFRNLINWSDKNCYVLITLVLTLLWPKLLFWPFCLPIHSSASTWFVRSCSRSASHWPGDLRISAVSDWMTL